MKTTITNLYRTATEIGMGVGLVGLVLTAATAPTMAPVLYWLGWTVVMLSGRFTIELV